MGSGAILPLLGLLACWTYLPPLSADLGICLLPPDGGLCFILQERWYYDREKKKCLPFSWGGCGGNENNFESRQECELACGSYDKPGSCPDRFPMANSPFTGLGVCRSNCFQDSDCKEDLKCCVNGCGQWACTKPKS